MPYKIPTDDEALDLLTDGELNFHGIGAAGIARGRQKAREAYRLTGPTGRLKELSCGAIGDSHLFTDYARSSQLSPMLAAVSLSEGVQFSCKVERSLVDGAIIGVRVTLVAFTR